MLVDLHCHLLPGIDDGAKDLDQALAMARLAVDDGIRTTVVTPHHLNGVYANPADTIREAVSTLRTALLTEGIGLRILPGAELHLVPELPEALASGQAMTLADHGCHVLVELPVHTVPVGSDLILEQILSQGLTPIIAHPERNTRLRTDIELVTDWVAMGCLTQVTGQSCTGHFGPAARDAARALISAGLVHVLASDAHRDRRRVPQLSAARSEVADWIGQAGAELLTETYPEAIIRGLPLDTALLDQALPGQERSLWQRWFGR